MKCHKMPIGKHGFASVFFVRHSSCIVRKRFSKYSMMILSGLDNENRKFRHVKIPTRFWCVKAGHGAFKGPKPEICSGGF